MRIEPEASMFGTFFNTGVNLQVKMKCVPVHHGIPAVLHRYEPWLHRHSENGALQTDRMVVCSMFYRRRFPVGLIDCCSVYAST